MRISYKWLQLYIDIKIPPQEIAETLTSLGLEVENVEFLGEKYNNFVVGEVISVSRHPNADKLSLCSVAISETENLQIVCGAPNVAAEQKVVVALVGAIISRNQHSSVGEPFVISKIKIRGIESNGMICSEYELGLGNDASGIMVLDDSAKLGTPVAQYFGVDDVIFEIGITPNRPDCLNHIGIAREISAHYKMPLRIPFVEQKPIAESSSISLDVQNIVNCPHYVAQVIHNVTIKPSPKWIHDFLTSAGIRPINNIVDITNFVMLEMGQPLHAFDYEKIKGKKIIVKDAKKGEKFFTLDSKEYTLPEFALMICDAEKPIAIAGIMGGKNSAIDETTRTIVLESAYFLPSSIRKTAKNLNMSTDASYRFERGVDPNGALQTLQRAVELIIEFANATVSEQYVESYPHTIEPKKILLRLYRVNTILGTQLTLEEVRKYLSSIQIHSTIQENEVLVCTIPTFRPDIEEEIDIVEEVARLYGYAKIEDTMVSSINFQNPITSFNTKKENIFRSLLEGNGFYEVITNSLIDEQTAKLFSTSIVRVVNPMSTEQSVLRPHLIPGMLRTLSHNENYGTTDFFAYEIGKGFSFQKEKLKAQISLQEYTEIKYLCLGMVGKRTPTHWATQERNVDVFDLKGIVETLLQKASIYNYQIIPSGINECITDETLFIKSGKTDIGFIGKVKQKFLQHFNISNKLYIAELNMDILENLETKPKQYIPLSKFPPVFRDIAFVIEQSIPAEKVHESIKKIGNTLLSFSNIFDVFEGDTVPQGMKSVAFSLYFSSSEKTLTDKEIEPIMTKIIEEISTTFGGKIRDK